VPVRTSNQIADRKNQAIPLGGIKTVELNLDTIELMQGKNQAIPLGGIKTIMILKMIIGEIVVRIKQSR